MAAQAITVCRDYIHTKFDEEKFEMLQRMENGRQIYGEKNGEFSLSLSLLIYVKPTTQYTSSMNWVLNLIRISVTFFCTLHLIGFYGEKSMKIATNQIYIHMLLSSRWRWWINWDERKKRRSIVLSRVGYLRIRNHFVTLYCICR